MRILVVDDDDCILAILLEVLTSTGHHEVTTAASAKEALSRLAESELMFDFLMVDIQMPGVDGIALLELVRQTPGYALTPVVMLTAMHDRSYVDRAFEAGATDYITKPFDYTDLKRRIQSAQSLALQNALSKDSTLRLAEHDGARRGGEASFENPSVLNQAKSLLGNGEFENYVIQLARSKSTKAWVYSIKMANLERLAKENDPDGFARALEKATTLIIGYFRRYGGIGAHRGRGTFLFVTTKRVGVPRERLEFELNALMESPSAREGRVAVKLLVGEQVVLDTTSSESVLIALRLSLENVERRYVPEGTVRKAARHFLRGRLFSDEQRRLEQRTYQSILQTILSDEQQGDWSNQIRGKKS